MINTTNIKRRLYLRRIVLRMILVIYDIIAINASFILTLYLRFYVAREMHSGSIKFFELFTHYTPFYTLFCLIVFACFKLYNGMWKYAGFNDLNRIIAANVVCAFGHVMGTLLLVQRMPRSFYIIGGLIQLCLVGFARFSFKLLEIEKKILLVNKKNYDVRAMIIGVNSNTRNMVRRLEKDTTIYPVCIMDYDIMGMGTILDGIPVVSGVDSIEDAIRKYNVNYVIFASDSMSGEIRKRIRAICIENEIDIQDYYDELGGDSSVISYRELFDRINGSIILEYNNEIYDSQNMINRFQEELYRYRIIGISAQKDAIKIKLENKHSKKLDLNEEWVKEQLSKTGEEISFF